MKIVLIIVLLLLSIAGSIFFFPVEISGNHVCLYEKNTCKCGPQAPCRITQHAADLSAGSHVHDGHRETADLVMRYIWPFGAVWWFSVLLLVLTAFRLRQKIILIHGAAGTNVNKEVG